MRNFIISLLAFMCFAPNAHAEWAEAKSENIIFVGDTSEAIAAELVADLEEFRATLFKLMKIPTAREVIPIKIYGVKLPSDVEQITGKKGIVGSYRPKRAGPIIILNLKNIDDEQSPSLQTAYHEYAHHIISAYTNDIYPRWYNEGFADYISTFTMRSKTQAEIGVPSQRRVNRLKNDNWLDMDIVTKAVRQYPNSSTGRREFYAQSWLAAHYIQSHPKYKKKFTTYLAFLNKGLNSASAFKKAFKMTPDAFGDKLKAYHAAGNYRTLLIELGEHHKRTAVTARQLSKGEESFHRGEAVRIIRRSSTGDKHAQNFYAASAAANGPIAQIHASKALIAIRNNRILQIAGYIQLQSYKNKNTPSDKKQIRQARAYLKRAIRANSKNMEAHYDLVSTYAAADDTPSKQVVHSAVLCSKLYKHRDFMGGNLRVAEVLHRSGRSKQARPLIIKAKVWASSSGTRELAGQRLANLRY